MNFDISGPAEPSDEEHDQPPYPELGGGRSSLYTGKIAEGGKGRLILTASDLCPGHGQ